MTRRSTPARAPLVASLALVACTTPGLEDAPRVVTGLVIRPYELHEECVKLVPGDRVEYAFESAEPVDFEIRYHEGGAVVMPIARAATHADAGVFVAQLAHDTCLTWHAGVRGTSLDYRLRYRPAQP